MGGVFYKFLRSSGIFFLTSERKEIISAAITPHKHTTMLLTSQKLIRFQKSGPFIRAET